MENILPNYQKVEVKCGLINFISYKKMREVERENHIFINRYIFLVYNDNVKIYLQTLSHRCKNCYGINYHSFEWLELTKYFCSNLGGLKLTGLDVTYFDIVIK